MPWFYKCFCVGGDESRCSVPEDDSYGAEQDSAEPTEDE